MTLPQATGTYSSASSPHPPLRRHAGFSLKTVTKAKSQKTGLTSTIWNSMFPRRSANGVTPTILPAPTLYLNPPPSPPPLLLPPLQPSPLPYPPSCLLPSLPPSRTPSPPTCLLPSPLPSLLPPSHLPSRPLCLLLSPPWFPSPCLTWCPSPFPSPSPALSHGSPGIESSAGRSCSPRQTGAVLRPSRSLPPPPPSHPSLSPLPCS